MSISRTMFARSDYRAWRLIPTRWSDNDVYGHVNNVVYYEWFDTAVNSLLIEAGVLDFAQSQSIGLVVETACSYFESVTYPETIETGIRVGRLGNSSVRYEVGIFKPGEPFALAAGHFIHVYVDRDSRRPMPLPAPLRAVLEPLAGVTPGGSDRAASVASTGPIPTTPPTASMVPTSAVTVSSPQRVVASGTNPEPSSVDASRDLEAHVAAVDRVMMERRSTRAFLPRAVPRATLEEILAIASRAPSGTNAQPWRIRVLTGHALEALCDRLCAVFDDPAQSALHESEYAYYPRDWVAPYSERRRQVGWALYGLLGIARGDQERMQAQHRRNFRFFDAPVGLIFTVDRVLEQGSWLDYGMFLQNVMLAARVRGLDTCPQAAFAQFHRVISDELSIPDSEMLVCGMALGYADPAAVENTLQTPRESVNGFAHFHGF